MGEGRVMELIGVQYIPSNGTEGICFMEGWCMKCAKDRELRDGVDFFECDDDELCDIIARSYMGNAVEWRELENGETLCTEFVLVGTPIHNENHRT